MSCCKTTRVLCFQGDSPPTPPQAGGNTAVLPKAPLPPACGGVGGEFVVRTPQIPETPNTISTPIEHLNPGDLVNSIDGMPHQILQVLRQTYSGTMFHVTGDNGKCLSLTGGHLVLAERRVKQLTPTGHWSGIPHEHFDRSRELRHNLSPPEVAVWRGLRGGQMRAKFRKQHPIGHYIADFYSSECGMVVEVDSDQHVITEKALAHDRERNAFMERLGLTVLRFSAHDVSVNLDGVMETIYRKAQQRTLESDRNKQWRLAEELRPGDNLYGGIGLCPSRIVKIAFTQGIEEVYDLRVENTDSYITALCVVQHCS